jgi:hypothetical protein
LWYCIDWYRDASTKCKLKPIDRSNSSNCPSTCDDTSSSSCDHGSKWRLSTDIGGGSVGACSTVKWTRANVESVVDNEIFSVEREWVASDSFCGIGVRCTLSTSSTSTNRQ